MKGRGRRLGNKSMPRSWRPPGHGAKRKQSERHGRYAEAAALLLFRLWGYRILARRYRCPAGELDIVARRGRLVVIVEVKFRARFDGADPVVGPEQQARIGRAAAWFLARYPQPGRSVRFDAVFVRPWRWPRHWPDAWRPEVV